jgi:hypothetical protein
MTTTVHDPVCHMNIDPALPLAHPNTIDKRFTSVHSNARKHSTRNQRNILAI